MNDAASSKPKAKVSSWWTLLAVVAFCLGVAGNGYRTYALLNIPGQPMNVPGQPGHGLWGMQDFRDAVYYPVVSTLEGNNPYHTAAHMERYPVGQLFPLYSPMTLLVHAPFGLPPLVWSELCYFVFSILLVVVLSALTLKFSGQPRTLATVFGLSAIVLFTRAAHCDLVLGQVTLQVVVAALLAIHYAAKRPWFAGVSLAVASLKPTYAVPLAIMMLSRGTWKQIKTVIIGTSLGIVGALIPLVWLAANGNSVSSLVQSIPANVNTFSNHAGVNPATSFLRVDISATLDRFFADLIPANVPVGGIATLICLAFVGFALWTLTQREQVGGNENSSPTVATGPAEVILCLGLLVVLYHQLYDCVLLIPPLVAIVFSRDPRWQPIPWRWRYTLAACLAVPLVNWIPDRHQILGWEIPDLLWKCMASLNSITLLLTLIACTFVFLRYSAAGSPEADAESFSKEALESRSLKHA